MFTVETKSGSTYAFLPHENSIRTMFRNTEIIVTSIKNMVVGERMTVEGHKIGIYGKVEEEKISFTTTTITKIG